MNNSFFWSPELAYVVGLITTDGSLSKDGRHVDITSKDIEQLENVKKCLGIKNMIGQKRSGSGHISWRVQIGNIQFYKFLVRIGLTPAKTKTIGKLKIPRKFFFDFLRGHFDGDGSFYVYKDKRWKSTTLFYLSFVSASKIHIDWLRQQIFLQAGVEGHITSNKTQSIYQLKFAKSSTKILVNRLYTKSDVVCLSRKYKKIIENIRDDFVYTDKYHQKSP